MTIPEIIKKAIHGGYGEGKRMNSVAELIMYCLDPISGELEKLVLDPKFWQAVGKAMGWYIPTPKEVSGALPGWHSNMHSMVDALAEGKTPEQFIATL